MILPQYNHKKLFVLKYLSAFFLDSFPNPCYHIRVPMKKEPYDSSTEKAKELKMEDFGTPDEVREIAKSIRTASTRQRAAEILKEISEKGALTNKRGLMATLSSDSRGKIVSSKALRTSSGQQVHFMAVANLDKLFYNAIEPWDFEMNPNKNNMDLNARRYLFAPLESDEKIIVVKITIKEYIDESLRKRIYSVEAVDTDLWTKNRDAGMLAPSKPKPTKKPLESVPAVCTTLKALS
ncbi:hypothetical protein AGMMS49546_07800 [Spirochaetia bacterium]|nr:hypothetical protein AGMMS49546_07800 [Spirochaetia bacterium]